MIQEVPESLKIWAKNTGREYTLLQDGLFATIRVFGSSEEVGELSEGEEIVVGLGAAEDIPETKGFETGRATEFGINSLEDWNRLAIENANELNNQNKKES